MSTFSVDSVETLDYDFTGFPKNAGRGKCKGKGVIPEPTQGHLIAYAEGLRQLYQVPTDDDDSETKVSQEIEKSATEQSEKRQEGLLKLTAALCQNSPSAAELRELPPRIRTAFMKHVYQELSNPKVLSADTSD